MVTLSEINSRLEKIEKYFNAPVQLSNTKLKTQLVPDPAQQFTTQIIDIDGNNIENGAEATLPNEFTTLGQVQRDFSGKGDFQPILNIPPENGGELKARDIKIRGGNILIASENVIAASLSRDGGVSWEQFTDVNFPVSGFEHIDASEDLSFIVGGTTANGLFISTDGGQTWVNKTSLDGILSNNINGIHIDESTGSKILYVSAEDFGVGGVVRSDNLGESFVSLSSGLTSIFVEAIFAKGNFIAVVINGEGIDISEDGGQTWLNRTNANSGLGDDFCTEIYGKENILYVTTGSGISYSTDLGLNFENRDANQGMISADCHDVFVKDNVVYVGTQAGIAITQDITSTAVNSFTNIAGGTRGIPTGFVDKIAARGNTLFASTDSTLSFYNGIQNNQQKEITDTISFDAGLNGVRKIITIENVLTLEWDTNNWLFKVAAANIDSETLRLKYIVVANDGTTPETQTPEDSLLNANKEYELASGSSIFLTDTTEVSTFQKIQTPSSECNVKLSVYGTNGILQPLDISLTLTSRGNTESGGVDIKYVIKDGSLNNMSNLIYNFEFDPDLYNQPTLDSPFASLSSSTLKSNNGGSLPVLGVADQTGGNKAITFDSANQTELEIIDTSNVITGDTTFDIYVTWNSFGTSTFERIFQFIDNSSENVVEFAAISASQNFFYTVNLVTTAIANVTLSNFFVVNTDTRVTINHYQTGKIHIYKDKILVVDENGVTPEGAAMGIVENINIQGAAIPDLPRQQASIGSNVTGGQNANITTSYFRIYNAIVKPV